jgi:SNF2 family DNA or RNA helicase
MKFEPSIPQDLLAFQLRESPIVMGLVGCGLGKTAVILHTLTELFEQKISKGALVVAPLRVCNLTWPLEVRKWDGVKHLKVANLRTPEGWAQLLAGSADLYLINYDQLQQFRDKYLRGRRTLAFDTVVWDELTKAKNHKSKRINAVRPYLRKHCVRHWGLTGTPTPNGLLDIFAQARLLDGGHRLGKEYGMFRDTYFYKPDLYGYKWVPKTNSRERIHNKIGDMTVTLKSSDWLDIPDVNEEDVELSLAPGVKAQYKELEKELLLVLSDPKQGDTVIVSPNAAVLMNKLLQVTSGAIYDSEHKWHKLHDGKMKAFTQLIKQLKGKPVLVAYQYQHELERILKAHPEAVAFSSAKSNTQQLQLVERWNAGKIPILVAHPKSMAHGLNMQDGGSVVIWFTLPWSPEDYDQLNARLARRGQTSITEVYRLITSNTVEEVVAETLNGKDKEQTNLLDALKVWKESLL